jgi:hypothetical protein
VLAGRDSAGKDTVLGEIKEQMTDYVKPHLFDDTMYFTEGEVNTVIAIGRINSPIVRVTASWNGHTVEVPISQTFDDGTALLWLTGLPADVTNSGHFPALHAYDKAGNLVDNIP